MAVICSSIIVVLVPSWLEWFFLQWQFFRIGGTEGIAVISFMLSDKISTNIPVKPLPEAPPLSTKTVISFPIKVGN